MNLIAIDIGNSNIAIGLFLEGKEKFIKTLSGNSKEALIDCLETAWKQVPIAKSSKEKKRDGRIVISSVKSSWTKFVEEVVRNKLGEKILLIGKDIPLPMSVWVDEPEKVGTDRVISAAAAYAVAQDAVVVADFGTAVTIDLIDEKGIFLGGVICPGFDISANALEQNATQLSKVNVTRPKEPYGKNTTEAINCGLYYSAVGTLEEIIRRYAEKLGKWPQTVITGSGAKVIKEDCAFIDRYVPDLVVKGIALAYRRYIEEKAQQVL